MKKSGLNSNVPLVVRKIEKDLLEIQKTIGSATADIVNIAFLEIQRKSFIDGTGATEQIGKVKVYGEVAGGNRASRKRPDKNVFHKTKVVDRGGNIPSAFNQISFQIKKGFSKKIAVGNNGTAKVVISRDGSKDNPKGQIVSVRWEGRLGQILNWLHFGKGGGKEKILIKDSKGKEKNVRVGQRSIAFNGLSKAMKRWNKYVEFQLTGTIKKRNRKKAK